MSAAIHSGKGQELLDLVAIPAALQNRTPAEQTEFLTKALRDEISTEGLAVLRKQGQFGPLTNIFPVEASNWASQAGVKPEDCVAFKLERRGLRAEVVLARPSTLNSQSSTAKQQYRIVRLNNIKQLSAPNLSTTNSPP